MKQVLLQSLHLVNFKGIKDFKLVLNGDNVAVYGDNAKGKTTLFDGFIWVLFGKDSQNKKDFAIKTLDELGKEMHNVEHIAEAVFLVDNAAVTFKKIYKEKWTKKRGQHKAEFTGHSIDHFVDDVPLSLKDYTAQVESIVNEEVFKLLTSPSYFNGSMKWQDRRKVLLEICGDISDEQVILSNTKLKGLPVILQNKKADDMKKIIASRKKKINDELEKIPVRIDEILKMIPETTPDIEAIKEQVIVIEKEIDSLREQKNNVLNGGAIRDKRQQLQELDMKSTQLKRDFEQENMQEVYKLQAKFQECTGNLQIVQRKLENEQQTLEYLKHDEARTLKTMVDLTAKKELLIQRYYDAHEQQFEYTEKCECPTCKQELPAEQLEEARTKALEEFNFAKSKTLAGITDEGKECTDRINQLEEMNAQNLAEQEKHNAEIEKITADVEQKRKEWAKAQATLEKAQESAQDVRTTETYINTVAKMDTVKNEITALNGHASEALVTIDTAINKLNHEKQGLNAEIATFANIETSKARIAELEAQQTELGAEYEKLEEGTFLIEEFIRTKVNMLTERINSKFKYARFKLFDEQVNGALQEVCETTYEGVPYSTGLNNAAKINVGLDIINTLSAHYGIQAPIFIDNAESVTQLIASESQLISLIVSEKDKHLRVETLNKNVEGI